MNRILNAKQAVKVLGLLFASTLSAMPSWGRDVSVRAYTMPSKVEGVSRPVMPLDGTWKFKYSPKSRWTTISVPGEAAMQGHAISHDKPFYYSKSFSIPADYAGKRIILRFDGVYSHARLSVNGKFVREHHGGFTRWDTDVTAFAVPGKKNVIQLDVEDRIDDISYASGYAHHTIGGILRNVTLFALPEQHVYDVAVETHLDSLYRDAELRFFCTFAGNGGGEIKLRLKDHSGHDVPLRQSRFALSAGQNEISLPVSNPLKWDAEHPNLYNLEATVMQDGNEVARFCRNVGFRDIRIVKDRMLVNGRPVKLRGACRHDIHPTLGRTTTAELDSLDAILFKQSNMNFVRTSHYPPNERFLEFCDRYGIYVESETAVCFVDTHRQKNYSPGNTQNDSAFADRYLTQCEEMVKSFRSHPSILFWSIGNESVYGSNFQACHDWVKSADTTRPVIFSYPGLVEKGKDMYDILSMHYPGVNGNMWQYGMQTSNFQGHGKPALFDEWAHPACYTYATLQTDPNIREFWGKSIDMMWDGVFNAPGALGGAIWGYIDDTFALPEPKVGTAFWKEFAHTAKPEGYQGKCVGYGEWGIVDVWRRKKPEFWSTKKAYSPVRLLADKSLQFTPGQNLMLTVYNRFDHTSLSETHAKYTYKGATKELPLAPLQPHAKGLLVVPAEQWEEGEHLTVEFFTAGGELIDAYRFVLGEERIEYPKTLAGRNLSVVESDGKTTICGDGFEIPFDKSTGLITNATVGGKVIMEKGPFLNLYINFNHMTGPEVRKIADHMVCSDADWTKSSFAYVQTDDGVHVALAGTYRGVKAYFDMLITPAGQLSVDYRTDGVPNGYLRETGLSFHLPGSISQLDWKRNGYWNCYPEGAFAGNDGHVSLYQSQQKGYGERPTQPWQLDTHNYYYWADAGANCKQPLTQTAKGMKENIYYYSLSDGDSHGMSVVSRDASLACRLNKRADEQLILYVNNRWDYPEIAWGNYCKALEALPCYGHMDITLR